jgi:hypothetical protein
MVLKYAGAAAPVSVTVHRLWSLRALAKDALRPL